MVPSRSVTLIAVLGALLVAARPAAGVTVSGTVRTEGSLAPAGGAWVGACRGVTADATADGAPVAVEWSTQAAADGTYALVLDPATPELGRVHVFTWSHEHVNEIWPAVDASGTTPRGGDLRRPGVVALDLAAGDRAGVDFEIASNRRTEMVLMRDGVTHLATDVMLPSRVPGVTWPAILFRTPYDKSAARTDRDTMLRDYALVYQDMRGRFASEGRDEAFEDDGWGANQDGYDTIEWVAAQPWCTGRVGMGGLSGPAAGELRAAATAPPHLACCVTEVAPWNHYRDLTFPGGVFLKNLLETWSAGQGNTYKLDDWAAHPSYDDYWRALDMNTRVADVRVPMLHAGGWYDCFSQGTLDAFMRLQEEGGPGARRNQRLVMGPWLHGWFWTEQQGDIAYPPHSIFTDRDQLLWDWYDFWLKDRDTGIMDGPPVRYYVMGPGEPEAATAPGNQWVREAEWPPASAPVPFYFAPGGTLSPAPAPSGTAPLSFDYDPANPVPTVGGNNVFGTRGPLDQATVDARADVLVWQGPPLAAPIEVTGRIEAVIFASSNRPDTDFVVKLEDVYPDGSAMLVADGALRARHRVSMETEDFLSPGVPEELRVDLWSTSLVFAPGHRVRVAVTSSNAPRFDPNPNTGEPFRQQTRTDVARNTVYFDDVRPSRLVLPVVDRSGAAPCASATEVPDLRVRKADAAGTTIELQWGSAESDPCHRRYRVYAGGDPSSWVYFVRNPVAEPAARSLATAEPFAYWLVVAEGTDGSIGPVGHFGR